MATSTTADQWSIREKLCLASSVMRSGDQNWVSVSRAIKPFTEPNRPSDWFSQKNCAIQYSTMLEAVETPKRKRSGEKGEVETPVDLLVRRMTQERIEELRHQISDDRRRFRQLQEEIHAIQNGQKDDQLPKIWQDIQEKKRQDQEALEKLKLAAEARAAAALKPKPNLQSPNKRRPPIRTPKAPPKQLATPTPAPEVEETSTDAEPIICVESPEPVTVPAAAGSEVEQKSQEVDQSQPALLSSLLTSEKEKAKAAEKRAEKADETVTIDEFTHIFTDSSKAPTSKEPPVEGQKQPTTPTPKVKESGTSQVKDAPHTAAEDSTVETGEVTIAENKTGEDKKSGKVEVEEKKQVEDTTKKTTEKEPTIEIVSKVEVEVKAEPETRKVESGGGKLLRSAHSHEPLEAEPASPSTQPKGEKKRGRGRPSNLSRKSARSKPTKPDEEEEDVVVSLEEYMEEKRSEAADSEDHDRPSESDDASSALPLSLFSDSVPNSPSSMAHGEEDHAYRVWRKAILMVWREVAGHKYASLFLHPVRDDIAPGYTSIVHHPLNLQSIKKKIENGVIRTTEAFHRNILLMFQNAIMYNNSDHDVHKMAVSMQTDVINSIEEFISTQLMVQQPDSLKVLRGRETMGRRSDVTPKDDEGKSRRSSTDHPETSGKKRRTRADEN